MSLSVEDAYEMIAAACNEVAPADRELMLAKLALVLSHALDDRASLERAIDVALRDLRQFGNEAHPTDLEP